MEGTYYWLEKLPPRRFMGIIASGGDWYRGKNFSSEKELLSHYESYVQEKTRQINNALNTIKVVKGGLELNIAQSTLNGEDIDLKKPFLLIELTGSFESQIHPSFSTYNYHITQHDTPDSLAKAFLSGPKVNGEIVNIGQEYILPELKNIKIIENKASSDI